MPTFTALYTRPDDAEAFLEEYKADHLPIAEKFPKTTSISTTVLTGTPRGTAPAYYVMFKATWANKEDFDAAMQDPALMEASRHAMGMLKKYGNSAEMMVGDDLA